MNTREKPSAEKLLALLSAAAEKAPSFDYNEPVTIEDQKWLGQVDALLEASGHIAAMVAFRVAKLNLGTTYGSGTEVMGPLYDAIGKLELMASDFAPGTFIPPGDTWNGYAALVRIIQRTCTDILIVDPYLNSDIFINFAPHCTATTGLRCLTVKRSQYHSALSATATKWKNDQVSQGKPVEVRYAKASELHDRLIVIDENDVWLVSQSIKDIAKKSPASVTRADSDLGSAKAAHYESVWNASSSM